MKIPTDLKLLNKIYEMYHLEYAKFERNDGTRESKIYIPIDSIKIANLLKVDQDIVFGRLYYHLERKYGYKQDDGSFVHFFALVVGEDHRCVNFPLLASVLAGLISENKRFWIGTAIAILALVLSVVSLTISFTKL